jgi:CDP-paratose 2-epimerase
LSIVIVTGSAGLIGSEAARFFAEQGFTVIGIDNDLRREFFGAEASTNWVREDLEQRLGARYRHLSHDIRNREVMDEVFTQYGRDIALIVHAAAQPSHDWAASDPHTDFAVNALGTLNLLEATRQHAPEATFVFLSTNKVYGDRSNQLPLTECEKRYEIDATHEFANGIPEDFSIDASLHSLMGASKASADLMVQEYGRYFGLSTACFRAGCLTGPNHSGTELHGFLAYLMKCAVTGAPYRVFGYKGKQVRDNLHSADLVRAINAFFEAPRSGQVYNMGGGRFSNCSMLEALELCESISGHSVNWKYDKHERIGDHRWWISDTSRFQADYPEWQPQHDVASILEDLYVSNHERWRRESR